MAWYLRVSFPVIPIWSYRNRVVLDCAHPSHLERCLNRDSQNQSSETRPIREQLHIGLDFMLMLKSNSLLNLVKFRPNPRIIPITVGT